MHVCMMRCSFREKAQHGTEAQRYSERIEGDCGAIGASREVARQYGEVCVALGAQPGTEAQRYPERIEGDCGAIGASREAARLYSEV